MIDCQRHFGRTTRRVGGLVGLAMFGVVAYGCAIAQPGTSAGNDATTTAGTPAGDGTTTGVAATTDVNGAVAATDATGMATTTMGAATTDTPSATTDTSGTTMTAASGTADAASTTDAVGTGGVADATGATTTDTTSTATDTTATDTTATTGSGGAASTATDTASATSATGGATTMTDTAATSTGGAATTAAGEPVACSHTVPPNANITDISNWDVASGDWGASTGALTGGSFVYDDGGGSTLTLGVDAAAGTLTITGTVIEYAGFGIWFGPCVDASAYTGLSFYMGGEMGEAAVDLQFQTNSNYPIADDGSKGACAFTSPETKWSECVNNHTQVLVSAAPAVSSIPFANFTGGAPAAMDSSELLGIQWQIGCGDATTTCAVDLVLDDIAFY